MARKNQRPPVADDSNRIKDPEEWSTGDEPMTGAQDSYLHTLASEAAPTEMAIIGDSRIADILANVLIPYFLAEGSDVDESDIRLGPLHCTG